MNGNVGELCGELCICTLIIRRQIFNYTLQWDNKNLYEYIRLITYSVMFTTELITLYKEISKEAKVVIC